MRMFGGTDDDFEDEGPIFGGSERADRRKEVLRRAKEIASGEVLGTFERDEEVWDMIRKLREDDRGTL